MIPALRVTRAPERCGTSVGYTRAHCMRSRYGAPMRRKLILLFTSTVLALVVAEGATRVWLAMQGRSYSRQAGEQALQAVLQGVGGLAVGVRSDQVPERSSRPGPHYQLHPYVGYVHAAAAQRMADVADHFRDPAPGGAPYTVLVQGGSVAASFQGKSMKKIVERLGLEGGGGQSDHADNPRNVQIIGLAVPGYKQPQQLLQLTYLLAQGCKPDLVLNLDGVNELRISSSNLKAKMETSFPARNHWASLVSSPDFDESSLEALVNIQILQQSIRDLSARILARGDCMSAMGGTLAIARISRMRRDWVHAQEVFVDRQADRITQNPAADFRVDKSGRDAVAEAVAVWQRSSLAMHRTCQAHGIQYVHVLQPTLHDEGSKFVSEEEFRQGIGEDGLHPAIVRGYPLLKRGMVDLKAAGVIAVDATEAFKGVKETLYLDSCHFSAKGNDLLVQFIIESLEGISLK